MLKTYLSNIIVLVMLFLWVGSAEATTLYVDNFTAVDCNGNYSIASRICDGADGDKYEVIQDCVDAMAAGDSCDVRAGTYAGVRFLNDSGTTADRQTLQAYTGETPIIDAGMATVVPDGVRFSGTSSYNTVDGFKITDSNLSDHYGVYENGVRVESNAGKFPHNNTVTNCEIYSVEYHGILEEATADGQTYLMKYINNYIHDLPQTTTVVLGGHGIYMQGNDSIIRGNRFDNLLDPTEDKSGWAIQNANDSASATHNNLIEYNYIKNYLGPPTRGGIVVGASGSNSHTIRNNIIYGVQNGIKISSDDCFIYNNTVYKCTARGIWVRSFADSTILKNNISYDNNTDDYLDEGTSTDDVAANKNLWDGTDPSFVYPPFAYFALNKESVAINAGVEIGGYTDGIHPNSWPATWTTSLEIVAWNSQGTAPEQGAYSFIVPEVPPPVPPGDPQITRHRPMTQYGLTNRGNYSSDDFDAAGQRINQARRNTGAYEIPFHTYEEEKE